MQCFEVEEIFHAHNHKNPLPKKVHNIVDCLDSRLEVHEMNYQDTTPHLQDLRNLLASRDLLEEEPS